MSHEAAQLLAVLSNADETIAESLLRAYRIGFVDGHVDGANFQRDEFARLVKASLASLARADADESDTPRGRLFALAPDPVLLEALQRGAPAPIRLWIELVDPA